jgi:hypothetical protein
MSVRFITTWEGYKPGDVATFSGTDGQPAEADLIAGHIARNATDNDNAGATDLQSQITALVPSVAKLVKVGSNYADDAGAATGGVAVGGLYHTNGTVKVRLT